MVIDLVDAETNDQIALQGAFHFINEFPEAGANVVREIDTVVGTNPHGLYTPLLAGGDASALAQLLSCTQLGWG